MSEYTPITGELRERIGQAEHIIPLSDDSKDMQVRINLAWLTEKLNAIDSIHAQLERENAALKAELDRVLGEQENRAGLLQLPLDANRVPIFIGDVMESDYITRTEVAAVGIKCFFAWSNIDGRWHQYEANQFRHHEPDTWERILADALGCEPYEVEGDDDLMAIVARCKTLCERTKGGDAE